MDDKYSGCNIVESTVTEVKMPARKVEQKPPTQSKNFFIRTFIALIAVGALAILCYMPAANRMVEVKDILRTVFYYDVFGRSEFGILFFG